MNYSEIKNAIEHLLKTLNCSSCDAKYTEEDIHIIATTNNEGLFEARCPECGASTILTVMLSPEPSIIENAPNEAVGEMSSLPRTHRGISQNDVLDMKNFLGRFDGNFKKLFHSNNKAKKND